MTQTYSQLQKQIATLQRQADALREKEISGVISRIKVAIDHYGLTAHQLGFGAAPAAVRTSATKNAATVKSAKFSDGNGNEWSGRGPRPHWLRDALASGRSLDEFMSGTPSAPAKKAKIRKFKRRPSSVLYRDGSGNSWTGRGPQPRWMKEALASGKTLEDLKG